MDATSIVSTAMQNPWLQLIAWVIGIVAGIKTISEIRKRYKRRASAARNIHVSNQSQYIERNEGQININQSSSRDE